MVEPSRGSSSAPTATSSPWLAAAQVGLGVVVVALLLAGRGGGVGFVVFFACGAAAVFTAWAVGRAVSSLRDPTLEGPLTAEGNREALEHEKRLALLGLRELEADIAAGKVDPADADHLKRTAEQRALQLIHRLREDDATWRHRAEDLLQDEGLKVEPERSQSPAPRPASPAARPSGPVADRRAFDERPAARVPVDGAHRCAGCEASVGAQDRYCGNCGRPLEALT